MNKLLVFICIILIIFVVGYFSYDYFFASEDSNLGSESELIEQNESEDNAIDLDNNSQNNNSTTLESNLQNNEEIRGFSEIFEQEEIESKLEEENINEFTLLAVDSLTLNDSISKQQNQNFIENHVILDRLTPERILELNGNTVKTLSGLDLTLNIEDGVLVFVLEEQEVRVTKPNLVSSGNLIFIVDGLIQSM